jgi:hypothetical protein
VDAPLRFRSRPTKNRGFVTKVLKWVSGSSFRYWYRTRITVHVACPFRRVQVPIQYSTVCKRYSSTMCVCVLCVTRAAFLLYLVQFIHAAVLFSTSTTGSLCAIIVYCATVLYVLGTSMATSIHTYCSTVFY